MMENLTASERLENLEYKLDELQKDMDEIWQLIDEIKVSKSKNTIKKQTNKKQFADHKSKIIFLDDRNIWKKSVYNQIDILMDFDRRFIKRAEVLRYIYNYMHRNYSIVWEQEEKPYKESGYKLSTIDVVYENDMYRSIFEAILYDMISDAKKVNKLTVVKPDIMQM